MQIAKFDEDGAVSQSTTPNLGDWALMTITQSVGYKLDADALTKLTGTGQLAQRQLFALGLIADIYQDQIIKQYTNGIERIPNPSITIFCVQCGIKGHFTSSGSATFSLLHGVTALSVGLDGNMKADLNLGLNAFGRLDFPVFSKRLLAAGVPGLSIPNIM